MEPHKLEKETSRLEAFSDGVFGFAITLLVLDIHVPDVKQGEFLLQLMLADWTTYLSYLIGFFTILICWINHHYMFDYIYKSNSKLLLFNGFKLLVVAFTPYATSVIAKYLNTSQQETAVSVYTFNFAFMGLSMFIIWWFSERNNLMKPTPVGNLKIITHYYFLAAFLSCSIFLLSFVHIWFCLALSGIMFIIFFFPELTVNYVIKILAKKNQALINTQSS